MTADTIVCRELVELVTDYLEGTLTPARREAVEAHLLACSNCTAYVEQMRTLLRLQESSLRSTRAMSDLPEGMLDGLLTAFRSRRDRLA